MSMKHLCLAGATALVIASATMAAGSKSTKDDKSDNSPGWVVIEEDWFVPLRFESLTALNNARFHYRQEVEKAAANKIDKAISWLQYAEDHADPITKEKLTSAAAELTTLSKDLKAGNTIGAAQMDWSLGRASHALAEWHYFKAKEQYGKDEAQDAARNLEAAAAHLQHAANSAHYEYGPDTVTTFDEVFKDGKLVAHEKTIDHNRLGMHLQSIEKAVKDVGDALNKS